MRALIAILTALMLFVAKPANSVELKPLLEVLTEEKSPAMAVYLFTRFAGLYLTLAALFHDVAPDKAKVAGFTSQVQFGGFRGKPRRAFDCRGIFGVLS